MGGTEISKREKARLKEMQKMKKQKIQEILDAQNAAIDADMVCLSYILERLIFLHVVGFGVFSLLSVMAIIINAYFNRQNNRGKGRLKYLLQQTEIFAHFAKGDQSASQKKTKGRYK